MSGAAARPRPTNPDQCTALRRDGQPCTTPARAGSVYCFAHDPDLAAQRREARVRGGENRATSRRLLKKAPPELRDVLGRLLRALEETHQGALDPRRATAMSALARSIAAIFEEAELAGRVEDLEKRLEGRR